MKKATLIAALIGIGVTKLNAEKMASLAPDDGTDSMTQDEVTNFTSEFKGIQKDLLKNDSEFVSGIQSAEKAKNFDQFERKMKQTFGLSTEDIKDKKFDEIIVIAKEKIGAGSDKTTTDLQRELLDLQNKYKNLEEVEIPKIKGEVTLEKKKLQIFEKFKSEIPTKNEKGEDILRFPFDTVHKLVKGDIEEAYDVDFDDKGEWVLKQKGTDLLAKSSDGTKFLTMKEAIDTRLEHHKALVKSNAGVSAATVTGKSATIIEGAEVKEKSKGQLLAEKNLEILQQNTAPVAK